MSVFKVSYLEAPARVNELKGDPGVALSSHKQVSTSYPTSLEGADFKHQRADLR